MSFGFFYTIFALGIFFSYIYFIYGCVESLAFFFIQEAAFGLSKILNCNLVYKNG